MDLAQWQPVVGLGVVVGLDMAAVLDLAEVEQIERAHVEARIKIGVGIAEEIARLDDIEARLLFHLPAHAFLARLPDDAETAGQVERAFGRLALAGEHQQLIVLVQNKGGRGSAGVEVIHEAAIGATLAALVVDFEMLTAAYGAKVEFL